MVKLVFSYNNRGLCLKGFNLCYFLLKFMTLLKLLSSLYLSVLPSFFILFLIFLAISLIFCSKYIGSSMVFGFISTLEPTYVVLYVDVSTPISWFKVLNKLLWFLFNELAVFDTYVSIFSILELLFKTFWYYFDTFFNLYYSREAYLLFIFSKTL